MPPPPPRSTLFPYTTLFRSEFNMLPPGDIRNCIVALSEDEALLSRLFQHRFNKGSGLERSEEHTSELQSRFDLVCRLLLEKKKCTINDFSLRSMPTLYSS